MMTVLGTQQNGGQDSQWQEAVFACITNDPEVKYLLRLKAACCSAPTLPLS